MAEQESATVICVNISKNNHHSLSAKIIFQKIFCELKRNSHRKMQQQRTDRHTSDKIPLRQRAKREKEREGDRKEDSSFIPTCGERRKSCARERNDKNYHYFNQRGKW